MGETETRDGYVFGVVAHAWARMSSTQRAQHKRTWLASRGRPTDGDGPDADLQKVLDERVEAKRRELAGAQRAAENLRVEIQRRRLEQAGVEVLDCDEAGLVREVEACERAVAESQVALRRAREGLRPDVGPAALGAVCDGLLDDLRRKEQALAVARATLRSAREGRAVEIESRPAEEAGEEVNAG